MIHCVFHAFIHLLMHSFIHCISVWVGSTWFDPPPPFQIGRGPLGTAASSLPTFPSSLSWSWDERSQRVKYRSPTPLPPLTSMAATTGWWNSPSSWPPHPSTTLCLSLSFVVVVFSFTSASCLHACTTVPLLQFSSQKLPPAGVQP